MLQIYNTLSKQKEIFTPLRPEEIGFYICGPTVYDYCHIGHARVYLAFDTIMRYLQYQGFKVKYIRNITDIDDKIIKRAKENTESVEALTSRLIKAMHEDFKNLNILEPLIEPRATEYIEAMIEIIQHLLDKEYAYRGENGDIYYQVDKFKSYGCLAHRQLEDLMVGARIEVNEAKRHPLDFVLWKAAKAGEPHWPAPWGPGRPGWHIECSAMALRNLGETFDIHGGGPDLKFPHHENERAQSEAVTGKKWVNYWMHVGYVQIEKEKMAKSLGNFITIRDFLKNNHSEVLRYFSISSHYRSPIDYTQEHIDLAFKGLERLYTALRGISLTPEIKIVENTQFENNFIKAMNDDFNTPVAIAVLFDLAREINRLRDSDRTQAISLAALLKKLGNIIGLLYSSSEEFLQKLQDNQTSSEEIEALIEKRAKARKVKDWAEADRIRDLLLARGIPLEDTATGGTTWKKLPMKE